jgi:hypothetical protein
MSFLTDFYNFKSTSVLLNLKLLSASTSAGSTAAASEASIQHSSLALKLQTKVVKNSFLTRHGTSNINSNCKIVKSQIKYFN